MNALGRFPLLFPPTAVKNVQEPPQICRLARMHLTSQCVIQSLNDVDRSFFRGVTALRVSMSEW